VRDVASPDVYTEDFSASVDFLGLQKIVDREQIGVQGICGLSGMALTAAAAGSRIKTVATASMYDMSRSISRGHEDYYTREQRQKIVDHLSRQRWTDAENGTFARGSHEIPFDENGNVAPSDRLLPKAFPVDADPITKIFLAYYRTERGYHPCLVNSTTAWTATAPMSFFAFRQMTNIDMLAPRKTLLVAGAEAHSHLLLRGRPDDGPRHGRPRDRPGRRPRRPVRPQGPHPLRQARGVLHREPRLTGNAPHRPVPSPACRGALPAETGPALNATTPPLTRRREPRPPVLADSVGHLESVSAVTDEGNSGHAPSVTPTVRSATAALCNQALKGSAGLLPFG
jgi:hypothetical protein